MAKGKGGFKVKGVSGDMKELKAVGGKKSKSGGKKIGAKK